MTTDTTNPLEIYRYEGRSYDERGDLVGVGPWSKVLSAANRMAVEAGDEPPFQMPERYPWGDDPDDSAEVYPEAWIITHLDDDPAADRVEIIAMSDRVLELLRSAHAEVIGSGPAPRSATAGASGSHAA